VRLSQIDRSAKIARAARRQLAVLLRWRGRHSQPRPLHRSTGLQLLEVLDLESNSVDDLDMLIYLADCPGLRALRLAGNPVAALPGYTERRVLKQLPQLQLLDSPWPADCEAPAQAGDASAGAQSSAGIVVSSGSGNGSGDSGGGGASATSGLYWRKLRITNMLPGAAREALVSRMNISRGEQADPEQQAAIHIERSSRVSSSRVSSSSSAASSSSTDNDEDDSGNELTKSPGNCSQPDPPMLSPPTAVPLLVLKTPSAHEECRLSGEVSPASSARSSANTPTTSSSGFVSSRSSFGSSLWGQASSRSLGGSISARSVSSGVSSSSTVLISSTRTRPSSAVLLHTSQSAAAGQGQWRGADASGGWRTARPATAAASCVTSVAWPSLLSTEAHTSSSGRTRPIVKDSGRPELPCKASKPLVPTLARQRRSSSANV